VNRSECGRRYTLGMGLIQGKDLSKMAIERLAGYCLGLLPILDGRPFFDSGSETWFYLTAPTVFA
jgi:hypothetical protein